MSSREGDGGNSSCTLGSHTLGSCILGYRGLGSLTLDSLTLSSTHPRKFHIRRLYTGFETVSPRNHTLQTLRHRTSPSIVRLCQDRSYRTSVRQETPVPQASGSPS